MVRFPVNATQQDVLQAQKFIDRNIEYAAAGTIIARVIQFIKQTNFQIAKAEQQRQQTLAEKQRKAIDLQRKILGRPPLKTPIITTTTPFTSILTTTNQQKQRNIQRVAKQIEQQGGIFGVGRFTKAVDVGRNRMQDIIFSFSKGKIIKARPIGKSIPQTQAFQQAISRPISRRTPISEERIRLLPMSMIPIPSIKQAQAGFVKIIDFVSGGAVTEWRLNKRGDEINRDIEKFNKNFGGRELSESEYVQAGSISDSIANRENILSEDRNKLARSIKSRISGFLSPMTKRRTTEETKKQVKKSLKSQSKRLIKIKIKINQEEKRGTILSKIKLRGLGLQKKEAIAKINLLESGILPTIEVYAGEFPIIPAISIPSGITTIKFLGVQKKAKGGKVITDIIFKTNKGRVGVAKGVSITKGEKTASVVLGRSGKLAFKFPSGKNKIISVRSFIGREIAITKPAQLTMKTKIQLLAKSKKIGIITKIKKNIQALQQVGIGQVATVKGRKFIKPFIKFPSGKIGTVKAKGILIDDFASISAIFTKKELSLIVGKSITRIGAKSRFIGIIKGISETGKTFSIVDKQQFSQALGRVIGVVSAGLAKSRGVSGITKATSLAEASRIAVNIAKRTPTPRIAITKIKAKPSPRVITKVIPKPRVSITVTQAKRKVSSVGVKAKAIVQVKTKVKPTVKTKQKQDQARKQLLRQRMRLRQLQKQQARLLQRLKQNLRLRQIQILQGRLLQVQKQIRALVPLMKVPPIPTLMGVKKIPRIIKIKQKKKAKEKKAKEKVTGYVSSEKRRTRTRLNVIPLTKARALDLLAYSLDKNPTIRGRTTKSLKKVKKSVLHRKLKSVPKGYFKRNKRKFVLRKLKRGRETFEMIEKKRFRKDSKGEMRNKRRKR